MTNENREHNTGGVQPEDIAEALARSIRPLGTSSGRPAAAELRKSLRALDELHDALALQWADIPSMPDAVRWLLDNAWLLRREGCAAARELSAAEHLRFAEGGTVLQKLCTALLHSSSGELNDRQFLRFLQGFQKALILEREELALLSCGLKWAIISETEALYRALASGTDSGDPAAKAAALFTALRELSTRDLGKLTEKADLVEQTLFADPAGIYPKMSRRSRDAYRRTLSGLARRHGMPEHAAARKILTLAEGSDGPRRHVGWWLLREPLGKSPRARNGSGYISVNVLLTLILTLLAGFSVKSPAAFFLLLVPVSELVKQGTDFLLLHLLKPVHIPRLALKGGATDEGRTLCVIPALLNSADGCRSLVRALENARLLNRDAGKNLMFALLADLPESSTETIPEQETLVGTAAAAIEVLNDRYGGGFFLLTRPRRRNADSLWCGWERKRGALLETMRFLRKQESGITVSAGDKALLTDVHFLLVLDSDTRTVPGAAIEMIGAMLHPLNRPVIDDRRGIVTEGYGILAPRVGITLSVAGHSDFSRIFAGQGGCDPYSGDCSETGMDLTGRGNFAGKGIIDIDAYLQCMDSRIPENRVLSHDAAEGAFLRCGFLGDVEVTDGFPGGVLPYYRRMERWTRGDWQNALWLFRRGRDLPQWEKWRLFDSMRRSLVPPATLAAILAGFFVKSGGLALAAAAALMTLLSELLLTEAEALLQKDGGRTVRYRSALFVGLGGGLVRAFLRLLLLPAEAWVCFSAAIRALWRMGISRRRLLQWQTSAESEGRTKGIVQYLRDLWFAPALGIILLTFAPGITGKTAGLLWLLTPLSALLLSLPAEAPLTLKQNDRAYLTDCARDTWQYFADFLTEEDHWLPPDNHQARPPAGTARRTSPTNIGFSLLSVLAAVDLGFLPVSEGLSLLGKMLDTVEILPKWNGHLYNWYETATCLPLEPRYVSTVDSGNLCACLIALQAGLREYGAGALALRAGTLADAMDFSPFYDRNRKLLLIGKDLSSGKASDGCYDLMASEARLTAYLAVARGDVPKELWQQLSRAQKQYGSYRGMASWTGTMFEYLMPELLLPLRKNSLLWESARFCLFVQRRRVRGTGLPWGISESAFWALDPGMNYRYKAHGCGHLALKRGMDEELVISPYSSFLALCVRPHAALTNLRALEARGLRDKWGFWEALDCTSLRLGPKKEPRIVRCVMAHHAGMSLVAAANLLTDGSMQQRFLSDPSMGAYVGLLEERVPVGSTVLRSVGPERREVKPPVPETGSWTCSGSGADFRRPSCCLLASETYSLLVTESGITRARWGQISPYLSPRSPLDREKGIELFWETEGSSVSLLPDAYGSSAEYGWQFSTESAAVSALWSSGSSLCTVFLPEGDPGECRTIHLQNRSDRISSGKLIFRFRPLLAKRADYDSHPAFCGLGISARTKNGSLLLRRLPRGEMQEIWLCLSTTRPCSFNLAPGGETGRANQVIPASESEYFLTEPLVTASCSLTLDPGEETDLCFSLALAGSETEALESAGRILKSRERADLPRSAAAVIGMEQDDIGRAFSLLPALCFPTVPTGNPKQEALWPFGISGDLPILFARYGDGTQLDAARRLMDIHLFLCGCGCDFDLVFLSRDGADYHRPLHTALSEALWHAGGELLRDARGGVHLVEDNEAARVISDIAVAEYPLLTPSVRPSRDTNWHAALLGRPENFPLQTVPRFEWNTDLRFLYYVNSSLPPRVWQNLLSNGSFGYVATDCGTGHMWKGNARENQLTPWHGRPYETDGPERLWLDLPDDRQISLFASPEDSACRVQYLPGAAIWEKRGVGGLLRVTAVVPADTDARVLLIETRGLPQNTVLHWQTELLMGSRPDDARFCRTAAAAGGLLAENPRSGSEEVFYAFASEAITSFTCDRSSALALDYDGRTGLSAEPVFAAKLNVKERMVLVCGCDAPEKLRALTKPESAKAALDRTVAGWRELLERLTLRSPDKALDRIMNGWCAYQAIGCRILGRCSVYQSGGAYGFRDQLQDAVNLIGLDTALPRSQILRACTRQYAEGDVQHWWHESGAGSKGVRTRCSDDLLWLPWAVCEYVEKTGDLDLCAEQLPYLASPVLRPEEKDRYETAAISDIRENVLRHCFRALERVMARGCGSHGLLRMGSGDWNDGFDAVEGESQWLTWFFLHVARRFAALCDRLGQEYGPLLDRFANRLAEAADRAWDGNWYLRGYYADGTPLGSHTCAECQIDSVAQSWAVLSGCAAPEKADAALSAATERLFDREHGLVKLFDPPFAGKEKPGYVACYGPGFRENGGQYTHGALWLVMALLRQDRRDEAWEMLSALLPGNKDVSRYLCEPFVIAADIYSAPGHEGEGGWSWYTGSAGWLWRIVTEELLGLKLRDGLLYLMPKLPSDWPGCTLRYFGHDIAISGDTVRVDGALYHGEGIRL